MYFFQSSLAIDPYTTDLYSTKNKPETTNAF